MADIIQNVRRSSLAISLHINTGKLDMISPVSPANYLRIKTGELDMTSPKWSEHSLNHTQSPASTCDPPERDKAIHFKCKINYLKQRTCILRKSN